MDVYLVQHGDALDESVDPERPLSEAGRRDVSAIAGVLAEAGVRPTRIGHSGKLRARQTAELIAEALAPDVSPEAMTGLAPNDPVEPIAQDLAEAHEDRMLVGHQPFMGRLAARLVIGVDADVVAFVPGSVVALERASGRFAIAWMLRPELVSRHRS